MYCKVNSGDIMKPDGEILNMFASLRNTELAALWTRFNIHLIVNGGLIATLINIDDEELGTLYVPAYVFGLVLNVIWLLSEYFGRATLTYRDRQLRDCYAVFASDGIKESECILDYPNWFKRQGHLSYFVIGVFTAAWLLLLTRAMCLSGLLS
jgi:hypothetical protein